MSVFLKTSNDLLLHAKRVVCAVEGKYDDESGQLL